MRLAPSTVGVEHMTTFLLRSNSPVRRSASDTGSPSVPELAGYRSTSSGNRYRIGRKARLWTSDEFWTSYGPCRWCYLVGNPCKSVKSLVRPSGFEPPTFCSGGNEARRKLLIRWNHWDHFST